MRIRTDLEESWRIALDALSANKARGALTTLGIIIGIVAVSLTMTAANGLQTAFRNSFSAVGTDVIYVSRFPWVVMRTREELQPPRRGRAGKAEKKRTTAKAGGTTGSASAAPTDTGIASAPADSAGKPNEDLKGVFVIQDGVVQFRRVTTGIASDTDFEVAGELKPGEKVITGPFRVLRTLKPGARVKIEEAKRPKTEKR